MSKCKMRNYECGPFIYKFPVNSCVFCEHVSVIWDYTNGMYLVLCNREHELDTVEKVERGCNEYEEVK